MMLILIIETIALLYSLGIVVGLPIPGSLAFKQRNQLSEAEHRIRMSALRAAENRQLDNHIKALTSGGNNYGAS